MSGPIYNIESQCRDKLRFTSKREAKVHRNGFRDKILSSKHRHGDEVALSVYKCSWCSGYHFGNAVNEFERN